MRRNVGMLLVGCLLIMAMSCKSVGDAKKTVSSVSSNSEQIAYLYECIPFTIGNVVYEFRVQMINGYREECVAGGAYVDGDVRYIGTYELQLVSKDDNRLVTCYDTTFQWEFKEGANGIQVEDCNADGREDIIVCQYISQNVNQYQIYTITDGLNIVEIGTNLVGKNISVEDEKVVCQGYDNSTGNYFTEVWKWNEEKYSFEREDS